MHCKFVTAGILVIWGVSRLSAAVGVVGAPASGPGSAGQKQVAAPLAAALPSLDSEEWTFLSLLNEYRAQNGAGPLQVSVDLENAAKWMSNDMATNNYFSHTDSLGRTPGVRLADFGYTWAWGENLAAGYSDAQSTLNQWATACDPDNSGNCTYAHRQNMLNPNYVVIGIARAYNASATYRWYWTTDFGVFIDAVIPPPSAASPAAPKNLRRR